MDNLLSSFYGINIYINNTAGSTDASTVLAKSEKCSGVFYLSNGKMKSGTFDAAGRSLIANWIDDNLAAIKKNIERYDSGNNILQIAPLNIDQ